MLSLFQLYKSSILYIYFQNDIIKDFLNLSLSTLEYLFSLSILFSNGGEITVKSSIFYSSFFSFIIGEYKLLHKSNYSNISGLVGRNIVKVNVLPFSWHSVG